MSKYMMVKVNKTENKMGKIILAIVMVMVVVFLYSVGENFAQRIAGEAAIKTAQTREAVADKFVDELNDAYVAVGWDITARVTSIEEDGLHLQLAGWDPYHTGKRVHEDAVVGWDETNDMLTRIWAAKQAALYSE